MTSDVHSANAQMLFGGQSPELRTLAKLGFLAISYDETWAGFAADQPGLTMQDARAVHETVKAAFPGVTAYRDALVATWRAGGELRVPGGWIRKPKRTTQVLNGVVQAAAATVFRRVLRELAIQLRPLGAGVVHQVHDEVFVAVPTEDADVAEVIVKTVMENAAHQPTGLLDHPVSFFVRTKRGELWSDFL